MKRLQLPSEKQFQEFRDQLMADAPGWKLENTKKENNIRVFSKEVEGTAVKAFRVRDFSDLIYILCVCFESSF